MHERPATISHPLFWAGALLTATLVAVALFVALAHILPASHQRTAQAVDEALGATLEPLDAATARSLGLAPHSGGLVVTSIAKVGPAAKADIRAGDVFVRANGRVLRSQRDLAPELEQAAGPAKVTLNRHGQFAMVVLATRSPGGS